MTSTTEPVWGAATKAGAAAPLRDEYIDCMRRTLNEAREDKACAQRQAEALQMSLDRAYASADVARSEAREYRSALDKAQAQLASAQGELVSARQSLASTQEKLDAANQRLGKSVKRIRIDDLEQALSAKTRHIMELETKLQTNQLVELALVAQNRRVQELEAELASKKQRLDELERPADWLRAPNERVVVEQGEANARRMLEGILSAPAAAIVARDSSHATVQWIVDRMGPYLYCCTKDPKDLKDMTRKDIAKIHSDKVGPAAPVEHTLATQRQGVQLKRGRTQNFKRAENCPVRAWHLTQDAMATLADYIVVTQGRRALPRKKALEAVPPRAGAAAAGRPMRRLHQAALPWCRWCHTWLERNGVRRVLVDKGRTSATKAGAWRVSPLQRVKAHG